MDCGGMATPFLTSELHGGQWSALRPSRFTPGKKPLVSIGREAAWAPKQVWTLWNREKSLTSAGNQTPAVQPCSRSLYRLSYLGSLYILVDFVLELKTEMNPKFPSKLLEKVDAKSRYAFVIYLCFKSFCILLTFSFLTKIYFSVIK
jgi:hypothetical protein